jgi:AraC-like DNA-binding protein
MMPDTGFQALPFAYAAPKLAAFSRVLTTDADEAADSIGRIFCPHRLDPVEHSWPDFHAIHNCADFSGFSINYVSYGGSVVIDPGCLERFFLLQVPLRGTSRVQTAGRDIAAAPDRIASLLSPTMPTRMVWQDNCAKLILLIDRRMIEARAAALAETATGAIEFSPEVDLTTPFGRMLQSQLAYLVDLSECMGPGQKLSPVTAAAIRDSLIGALLTGQQHNRSAEIEHYGDGTRVLPAALKKALAYLEAHAAEPLDLDHLARSCGAGLRSLQIGFKRHFGLSISAQLRDIRLAHLKRRLSAAAPGEQVIDIAFDLGFTHPSRMAAAYRERFGETPSQTLRKGQD